MALPDWILGVLLRPGETFDRARTEMRYSYWLILLSVLTVETILAFYHPDIQGSIPSIPFEVLLFSLLNFLLVIYSAQILLLYGMGRLFGWALTFNEAMKYTGLLWSLFLVEDLVTFVPYLKEQNLLLLWLGIPFLVWRVMAQTIGIRRVSGLSLWHSVGIVILATLPWQVPLLYAQWLTAFK